VDIAKSLALGCVLGGMASPFLKAALQSQEKTLEIIETTQREIQICMFGTGAGDLHSFQEGRLELISG
jgi:isopentenyl-diphosphate delta-isomerase